MSLQLIIVWSTLVLGWLLYKKWIKFYRYFEATGIAHEKPYPLVGNFLPVFMGKESFFDAFDRLDRKFCNEKIYGIFSLTQPTYIVRDPELIRQITIKDFDSFVNHDRNLNDDLDKLTGKMLFSLTDEKWRHMRNILSPIFTSSKMKMMFGILSECADEFVEHFVEKAKSGRAIVDCKESYSRFTVDGISTAVLGFKGDCVKNPDSKLFKFALTLNTPTFMQNMKMLLFTFWKWLYIKLGLQINTKETYDFFYNAIIKVMKERDEKGIFRPDVVQLLLQAKKGQLQSQDKENEVNEKELSNFAANIEYDVQTKNKSISNWADEHYMSQGFLFFGAGFETTNVLLQITTYFLAKNKEVQQELIDEIDSVLSDLDGKPLTYEALHKMKFLDCVISEALRMWPPALLLMRQCNRDYVINLGDGKKVEIKNGENLTIPTKAIQNDPNFFENPERFDPHRFDDDRKDAIPAGAFTPFGSGPRVCIGSRFALMEVKLLIFHVLSKLEFDVCEKTPSKLEMANGFTSFGFKEKIFVEYKLRK